MSVTKYGLGRLESKDENDLKFLMRNKILKEPPTRLFRNWNNTGYWGNQYSTNKCVGFGFAHYVEDGPITHKGKAPIADPDEIYRLAQTMDDWSHMPHEGTSIRAGAKALQQMGYITEYNWSFNLSDTLDALLEVGPVVIGVNWYTQMFEANNDGIIKIGGINEGGHCVKLDGANMKTRLVRLKNSWGRGWAANGSAFISFDNLERLIHENGEICLAIELKKPIIK